MPLMILLTFIKKLGPKRFYALVSFIFILIALGGLYVFNIFYLKNKNISPETEAKIIIEKVDKLVFLPKDETPTTAKVSSPDLLMDQVFFKDAKKGDVVLIYTNAKKAFLYDPTANKIVNISSINIGNPEKPMQTLRNLPELDAQVSPDKNKAEF
jgi:hypothetical protein